MSRLNRTLLSLMIFLIAGGGIVQAGFAQSNFNSIDFSPFPKSADKLIRELDLTSQQVQQLKAVRQEFRGQKQELKKAIAEAEKELAALVLNNASAGQQQRKREQVNTLKQKLAEVRARNSDAVRRILSAEQWTKLQAIRAQRRGQQ